MAPLLPFVPDNPDPPPPRRPSGFRRRAHLSVVPGLLPPGAVVPAAQKFDPVPPRLVAAAQAGDPDSVDQLCRVLWGPVYSTAASALKRADLAEDCAQDTLYIISRRLRALDTSRNIVGFARRIALHEAHRIWKRWMRPLPEVDDQLPSCDPSPFEVAAREEMLELLRVAGDKLLPKYRAVFQLRVAGAPIADIAQALGISNLGTVRCILSRAYQMLRNHSSLARAVA